MYIYCYLIEHYGKLDRTTVQTKNLKFAGIFMIINNYGN